MKTIFNVTVAIDDKDYDVVYTLPTKKQTEGFEKLSVEDNKAIEKYTSLNKELELLEDERANNLELIPHLSGDEKVEAMKEQRAVLGKIKTLTPKVEAAAKVKLSEKAAEERFTLLVSGPDKEKLKADALAKEVPLSLIMNDIFLAVSEAKEKK